jgi:uncharacterized protein YlxW (UPF0749 family)
MTTDNWTPVQRKFQPPRKKAKAMTEYNRREQARIEKLQAEVEQLRSLIGDLNAERVMAKAEVARLTAALTQIATLDGHAHMYRRIARAAVERKP